MSRNHRLPWSTANIESFNQLLENRKNNNFIAIKMILNQKLSNNK